MIAPDDKIMQQWEQRMTALWAAIDAHKRDAFIAKVEELTSELPSDSAIALFERGCANDSMGYPEKAVPLYRQALSIGLTGLRRRRAVIQLASSLRNLGKPDESIALLTAEQKLGSDELDDAITCTLALALSSVGDDRKALSLALLALAKHLPRYHRSMTNYAKALLSENGAG